MNLKWLQCYPKIYFEGQKNHKSRAGELICLFFNLRSWYKEKSVSFCITTVHGLLFQNNEYMQSVARCLQMMLRIDEYRFAFVAVDGISTLLAVLQGRVNFQVQYQLIFCLWVLTFNPLLAEKMNKWALIHTCFTRTTEAHDHEQSFLAIVWYLQL